MISAALKTLDVTVKLIRPDVALAHVTNEMSGVAAPDGTVMPPHQELAQHPAFWSRMGAHGELPPFTTRFSSVERAA